MKLKLFIALALLNIVYCASAQDIIFWSDSSANGNWEWGLGCNANNGGNWYWSTSGTGNRQRPDCFSTYNNIIKFDNGANTNMNLNSNQDFSVYRMFFLTGTPDRTINTDVGRRIFFQNWNGYNCKIENQVTFTTHTFNVDISLILAQIVWRLTLLVVIWFLIILLQTIAIIQLIFGEVNK